MKLYKKIIEICEKSSSEKSTYNSLVSCKAKAVDEQLISLIDSLNRELEPFATAKSKSDLRKMDYAGRCYTLEPNNPTIRNRKSDLILYCEKCIRNEKPEWQVMAEKYGWTPPCS